MSDGRGKRAPLVFQQSDVQLEATYGEGPGPGLRVHVTTLTRSSWLVLDGQQVEFATALFIGPGALARWMTLQQRPFKSDPERLEIAYAEEQQTLTFRLTASSDTMLLINRTRSHVNFARVPQLTLLVVGPAASALWASLSQHASEDGTFKNVSDGA